MNTNLTIVLGTTIFAATSVLAGALIGLSQTPIPGELYAKTKKAAQKELIKLDTKATFFAMKHIHL